MERDVAPSTLALAFALQARDPRTGGSWREGSIRETRWDAEPTPTARIGGPVWSFLAHLDRLAEDGLVETMTPMGGPLSRTTAFLDVVVDSELVRRGCDDSIVMRAAGIPRDGGDRSRSGTRWASAPARGRGADEDVRPAPHGATIRGGTTGWRSLVEALGDAALLYDETPSRFVLGFEDRGCWAWCRPEFVTAVGPCAARIQPALDHLVASYRPRASQMGRFDPSGAGPRDRRPATAIPVARPASATLAAAGRTKREAARGRLADLLHANGACERVIAALA